MAPTADSRSSTEGSGSGADGLARITLGRVVGAHGLRGGLRVRSFSGGPESLLGLERVELARDESDPEPRPFAVCKIAAGRPGELRVDLEGVRDRDAALALRGLLVLGEARALAPLGPGEWYGHQLLGCRVEGEDGTLVGTVCSLWETRGSDLLEVEAEGGALHLIPAPLLRAVDVEARRIVIELLPGLLGPE